jgi:hypothetical protein
MSDGSNFGFYDKNLKRSLFCQRNGPPRDPIVSDLLIDNRGFSGEGGHKRSVKSTNPQNENFQTDSQGGETEEFLNRPEHDTVMTVVSQGINVGVAAYDRNKRKILVAQFIDYMPVAINKQQAYPEGSFCTLQTVKLQVRPTCIVVSSKADHKLLEACRRHPLQIDTDHVPHAHGRWQQQNGTVAEECDSVVKLERASTFQYHQVQPRVSNLLHA